MADTDVFPAPAQRRSVGRHLPAALAYVGLTAVVLWPAIVHFRTRAMADGVDAAMFTWLWWEMPRALADGSNPFSTDLIFHPVGADLSLTTSAPLVSILTWPVQATLGLEAQVNTVQLLSMFLAGMATYLLADRLCRHRGAAFVAGLAYALLPARFAHVDSHLNLVFIGVLPLGILVFLCFLDAPSWRRAIALGTALGLTFLVEPQLAILFALGVAILAVSDRDRVRGQGRRLAGSIVVAAIVAAPLLVPMVVAMTSGGRADPDPTSAALVYSSSPVSWVLPPLDRLWIGHAAMLDPPTPTTEGIAYPGAAMLLLAVAGAALVDRERRRGWVMMALVTFVLSLGPYLLFGDTYIRFPLPFFAVGAIPGLDAMRVPGRFALLGALAVHVMAAVALGELLRRIPRRSVALVVAIGTVTLVELLPRSLPSRPNEIPAPYEQIAADEGTGAVLEIPLKWSTTQGYFGFDDHDADFMFLLYAIEHERPTVSGAVSRYSQSKLDRLLAIPTYRQLLALGGEPDIEDPARFDRADLQDLGIGYVVYHRDDPVPRALRYLRSLDLPVLADDGTVIVWKVS